MKFRHAWVFFLLLCTASNAADDVLDLQIRSPHYYISFTINADGTAVESREWSRVVLKEQALEWAKRASITYSTSAQKAEIVSAYTKKPDGRRIDVPKDNYQVGINQGRGKDSPVYSDHTTLTVVFPDVAVGDTVVLSYRLIQTEPLFPNHFSITETFSNQFAYDDVRVRFDYPSSLHAQHEGRHMVQKEKGEKAGRNVIEWTYANTKPLKNERQNYSVFDPEKEVGYVFSTFKTYADIASAYGARALPKAVANERIRKLAADIVQDKTAPKDQARVLYEWVATNITYAGNCIGVGAVVPRDTAFILDNKMGDCKDHATLLQALLSARGIKSTQALVNAGSIYRLPKIPVVSTVNHVITYIPMFDLFLDSTSNSTPFGMLPFQSADKPVLLVEEFKDGMKTPSTKPVHEKIVTIVKISSNGSISGTTEVLQNGQNAAETRSWMRKMNKNWEDDFVKAMFREQNMVANGKIEKDDPTPLTDRYRYKVMHDVEKYIKYPGAGAFYIFPVLKGTASIWRDLDFAMRPEKDADIACWSGSTIEEYEIELPKSMKVLSIPENLKVTGDVSSYEATYKMKGNKLIVKRTFDDRTKGNICSPQMIAKYKVFADKVMDNLKEQVLYK